jgi:hypothetical protein
MKRLVWVILAVFCASLGQVQAVDTLGTKAKPCSCCHPGACGMPGCCPPLSSASPVPETARAAEVARQPSSRQTRLKREWAQGYHFSLVALAEIARQRAAPAIGRASAANVPLFTAHCSLLI